MVPEKKKKKNPPGTRDKSISNHRPEKKEKIIGQKERKRPTSPDPLKKIKGYAVKRKLKHSANPAMLQLQECSTRVGPIIKLT